MAEHRNATWISSADQYRTGDANGTPYVSVERRPGTADLTLFFAGNLETDSSRVECIDAMIAALQELRNDALRRMAPAQPHPAGDGAEVPHRSIATKRSLAYHLLADHHADENIADLLGATDVALEARHRGEHLDTGQSATPDDDDDDAEGPETREFDPGPEVDDEGGMSEYRYVTAD